MIQGMEAAQRAYDRQEPREDDEETRVHSSRLSGDEIFRMTRLFINELAEASINRFEELLGDSPSNLDFLYREIAKNYAKNEQHIDQMTNAFFWHQCKKMALNAYDKGYLDL